MINIYTVSIKDFQFTDFIKLTILFKSGLYLSVVSTSSVGNGIFIISYFSVSKTV